jgi:hypothetical protein
MAVNCEKVVNDLFAAWTRLNLDEVMVTSPRTPYGTTCQ